MEPTTPSRAAPRDPWWQVALTLLTVIGVVAGVAAAWRASSPATTPAERYMPLDQGLTLSYRVTEPGQSAIFESQNVERASGINALLPLDTPLQVAIAAAVTGVPADQIDADRYGAFLRQGAEQVTIARVVSTELRAGDDPTRTTLLLWSRPEQIDLLAIADQPLDPPAPVFSSALAAGEPLTTSGIAGDASNPYTATLTLEAIEPVATPAGEFEGCRRVLFTLSVGGAPFTTRSWYCPGVGVAQQERTQPGQDGVTRATLVGASAPGLTVVAEAPAAPDPAAGPAPAPPSDAALDAALSQIWSFREDGQNTHITTPPAATADLLIYGTQSGGLLAIDRATHQQRWRFQTGGAIVGAPTIADGVVLVGSADRRAYAIDLGSGMLRWAFLTRDAISGSPVVAGGRVYVGSEDRTLYALDQQLGRELWRFTAGDAIAATPLVDRGAVYVGSDDGALYALDAQSGELRWAFATDGAITSAPLIAGDTIYVGSQDGGLYALAAETGEREGELRWRYDSAEAIVADLASDGATIFLTNSGGEVHAVDMASGERRWRYDHPTTLYGAPWRYGQRLLINAGRELVALDAASGAALPPIPTGDPASYHSLRGDGLELFVGHRSGFMQVLGPPRAESGDGTLLWQASDLAAELFRETDALAAPLIPADDGSDRLIAVSVQGQIYAISPADGSFERIGQLRDISVVVTPVAASEGALLVGDATGLLIAFDLGTGQERWRAQVQGNLLSAPILAGRRALISTIDGETVRAAAFAMESGDQLWERELPSPFGFGSSAGLAGGHMLTVARSVAALSPTSGETIWETPESFGPLQLTVDGGRVYAVGIELEQGVVLAWDAATGEELGRAEVAIESPPNLLGGIAASGDLVALALSDSGLLLVDLGAGELRWRATLPAAAAGPPVIDGDTLRIITADNHLLGFGAADGELVSDFAIQGAVGEQTLSSMAPLLLADRLYAAFYQTAFAIQLR